MIRHSSGASRSHQRSHQRGAALVISLVLVLVATLVGISAMEASGVETKLVANEGFRLSASSAAESAAESALFLVDVGNLPEDADVTITTPETDPRVSLDVVARAQGQSLKLGFSSRVLVDTLYIVSSTATIDSVDTRRVIVQGAAAPSVPASLR